MIHNNNDDGRLILAAIVGFGYGLYTFVKGFRTFRELRVVADTPEIPIRSMPMGLVHIRGQARSDQTLISPVTRTPCYLYQVVLEEWHSHSKGGGEWKHMATDLQSVKFYLEDRTGNVMVDAGGAELDLPRGPVREVRGGGMAAARGQALSVAGAGHATDVELLQYIEQARVRHFTQAVGKGIGAFVDRAKPAQQETAKPLLGFLADPTGGGASGLQDFMVRSMLAKRDPTGQTQHAALEVWKHQPGTPEFQAAMSGLALLAARTMNWGNEKLDAASLLAQAQQNPQEALRLSATLAAAADPQADPVTERARQAALAYSQAQVTRMAGNMGQASGHFRLTEYCLLPGRTYDLTGTCAENPQPRDEFDRNIVLKGTHETTFLISSRTEKQVESWLRGRAAARIFGGAALAIICLAFLLWKAGMF